MEERGRVVTRGLVGGGKGTRSMIVWASTKAFARIQFRIPLQGPRNGRTERMESAVKGGHGGWVSFKGR